MLLLLGHVFQSFQNLLFASLNMLTLVGVSESSSLLQAYENAFSTDPTSAFGGVIAFNETLSRELAKLIIDKQFVEVIIAPVFDDDAKKLSQLSQILDSISN